MEYGKDGWTCKISNYIPLHHPLALSLSLPVLTGFKEVSSHTRRISNNRENQNIPEWSIEPTPQGFQLIPAYSKTTTPLALKSPGLEFWQAWDRTTGSIPVKLQMRWQSQSPPSWHPCETLRQKSQSVSKLLTQRHCEVPGNQCFKPLHMWLSCSTRTDKWHI